ncbi:MAG: hypothetical protein ACRDJ2_12575 [Actinomycetota bacterium]
MLLTPIPLGERRSSGLSAPHSTYLDENYLLIDVTVTALKPGCVLGVIIEYLDDRGAVVAADDVSAHSGPHELRRIVNPKGCAYQMKWVLTGTGASSTFSVCTQGVASLPSADEQRTGCEPILDESRQIDLTTMRGLRAYVDSLERRATSTPSGRLLLSSFTAQQSHRAGLMHDVYEHGKA